MLLLVDHAYLKCLWFQPKTDELLNTVLTEMNVLTLTKNKPPILSPLIKQHPNQKIGPNQSDILKVNITILILCVCVICIYE